MAAEIVGGTSRPRTRSAAVSIKRIVASTSSQEVASTSSRKKAKTAWTDQLQRFEDMTPEQRAEALGSDKGFCVAEDISLEDFHKKCDEIEKGESEQAGIRWCFRMEFRKGKAWIYELPHAAHDRAAAEVIKRITMGMGAHADDVIMASSPRCDDNNGVNSFGPDGSVSEKFQRPGPGQPGAADATGNRFPNFIVEVAYDESAPHARRKAIAWLNASNNPNFAVQQVIVIKIGPPRVTRGNSRRMEAWRYEQAAPPAVNDYNNFAQHFDFGVPMNGPGLGVTAANQMVIQIPTASFYQPANVPGGMQASIDVDLFSIRDVIERST
ncbi:expressed unknown protein [Seminavis robusta]|uniref:Uncharacterized protein n=1 Tax=Seminavis robusta TaxID=568900 RepID=A0A9N8E9B9_9STRA|nr:expressed unknown protein [Seminavis robusta]|eukprot:Sro636_g179350.1 n/a (325) ;mRNA; f:50226-51200